MVLNKKGNITALKYTEEVELLVFTTITDEYLSTSSGYTSCGVFPACVDYLSAERQKYLFDNSDIISVRISVRKNSFVAKKAIWNGREFVLKFPEESRTEQIYIASYAGGR